MLDPERTIQIGIRGGGRVSLGVLLRFRHDRHPCRGGDRDGRRRPIEKRAREVVGNGPTYVSFDVDSLDPAFAPGTGTPEVGGLSSAEALAILRGCLGVDIIGGDVVEVAPQYDATTNTAQVAAQVLFTILCLAGAALKARAGDISAPEGT